MPLDTWSDRVLPDAARDGHVIGVNRSGPRLVGWSFTPEEVLHRLTADGCRLTDGIARQSARPSPADECGAAAVVSELGVGCRAAGA
jgi:hypothetical protein